MSLGIVGKIELFALSVDLMFREDAMNDPSIIRRCKAEETRIDVNANYHTVSPGYIASRDGQFQPVRSPFEKG